MYQVQIRHLVEGNALHVPADVLLRRAVGGKEPSVAHGLHFRAGRPAEEEVDAVGAQGGVAGRIGAVHARPGR
jgi:hypothetical protein